MSRLVCHYSLALLLAWGIVDQDTTAVADSPSSDTLEVLRLSFRDDSDVPRSVTGQALVTAQDGGMMLRGDDGRIWTLQPEQITGREKVNEPFVPISADRAAKRMLGELGNGFQVHRTQHYVIIYNSTEAYAKRVGMLFETLYRNFFTYWKNQRWKLDSPEFPLVAVVLKDHSAFLKHATREIGAKAGSLIGYYNLASNQVSTFNVPDWERNVSTIIHEATHQLAYNCGLQTRFADNPTWVSEGLATFFEAPDLRNPGKWRAIGRVNVVNLQRWRNYIRRRPQESLVTLLTDDSRYQASETATDAYAEGWALTYFLIKTRRKQYVKYLKTLSEGQPLAQRTPRERIELFEQTFQSDWEKIDRSFLAFMRRVR